MQLGEHVIAVCSWSLAPTNVEELITALRRLELAHVHLDLTMLLKLDDTARVAAIDHLHLAGVTITAGMVTFAGESYSTISAIKETGGFVPDATWEERRDLTVRCATLAGQMGITRLSAHAGFIPPQNDVVFAKVLRRVDEVGRRCADHGVDLLLETGQERAGVLLQFLNELSARTIGVNFDPGNMILYGSGDPVQAANALAGYIRHVHIKDAVRSGRPRLDWGEEVPFGTGDVNVKDFIDALHASNYRGPLAIEREAGNDRLADIQVAIYTLRRVL